MKKIKVYLGVALLGAMSFGAFTAYDYVTMSAEEKAILENVEALTSNESSVDMRCEGYLGWCSFDCSVNGCNFSLSALGSRIVGTHSH